MSKKLVYAACLFFGNPGTLSSLAEAGIVTEVESGLVGPYRIAKKLCCTYELARRIVAELLLTREAEMANVV